MSEHTFEVGEVAIIAVSSHPRWPVGKEVTILGPLHVCRCVYGCCEMVHTIDRIPEGDAVAPPRTLRKKRPPQDWVKLCNLRDLSEEVPA